MKGVSGLGSRRLTAKGEGQGGTARRQVALGVPGRRPSGGRPRPIRSWYSPRTVRWGRLLVRVFLYCRPASWDSKLPRANSRGAAQRATAAARPHGEPLRMLLDVRGCHGTHFHHSPSSSTAVFAKRMTRSLCVACVLRRRHHHHHRQVFHRQGVRIIASCNSSTRLNRHIHSSTYVERDRPPGIQPGVLH